MWHQMMLVHATDAIFSNTLTNHVCSCLICVHHTRVGACVRLCFVHISRRGHLLQVLQMPSGAMWSKRAASAHGILSDLLPNALKRCEHAHTHTHTHSHTRSLTHVRTCIQRVHIMKQACYSLKEFEWQGTATHCAPALHRSLTRV